MVQFADMFVVLTVIAAFFIRNSVQQCDPNCALTDAQGGCKQSGTGNCDGLCNPGYTRSALFKCIESGVTTTAAAAPAAATTTRAQVITTTTRPAAPATQATTTPSTKTGLAQSGTASSSGAQQNTLAPGSNTADPSASAATGVQQNTVVPGPSAAAATGTQAAATGVQQNTVVPDPSAAAATGTVAAGVKDATNTGALNGATVTPTPPGQSNQNVSTTKKNAATFVLPTLTPNQVTIISIVPPIITACLIAVAIVVTCYTLTLKTSTAALENAATAAIVGSAPPTRSGLPPQTSHVIFGQDVPVSQYSYSRPPIARMPPSSGVGYGYYQPPVVRRFWR